MNDQQTIEWLLAVMHRMRLLSKGEPCQEQDRAELWLQAKLQETKQ